MKREATREATPVVTNAAASSEAEASTGADDSARTTQQESSGGTRHTDQRGNKKRPIFTALAVGCIMVAIATACVAAFAHKSADIPKASLTSESTTEAPSPDITLEATLSPTPTPSPSPKRDGLSDTSTDTSASEATTPCPAEDPSSDTGDASSFASSSDSDSPWVQRGQQASDSSAGLIESEAAPTNETDTTTPTSSTPNNTSSSPTSAPALTNTPIPSDTQTSEPAALEPSPSPETSEGPAPTSSEPTTEPTPSPREESSSSTESEAGSSSTSSSSETVEAIPTPSTSLPAGSSSGSTPSPNEESSTATAPVPVSGSGSDSSSAPPSTSRLLTVSTSANASNFVLLKNIAVGADGAVYLSDEHRILRYIEGNNAPSVYSGSLTKGFFGGNFADTQYDTPKGLAFDSNNNLYVSDSQNFLVRILDASAGTVRDFAGSRPGASGDGSNQETKLIFKALDFVAADRANNLYLPDTDVIWMVDPAGKIDIFVSFPGARGIAIDSQQGFAYVTSANAIHRVSADGLTVTTIAGDSTNGYMDGSGEDARFYNPLGLAFDQDGNLLVADSGNHCIRKITLDDNIEVTTLAGQCTQAGDAEGPANGGALFTLPSALALHSQSGAVYVVDGIPSATRLRKIL